MNQIPFPPRAALGVPLEQLGFNQRTERLNSGLSKASELAKSLAALSRGHAHKIGKNVGEASRQNIAEIREIWSQRLGADQWLKDWAAYTTDFVQRSVLFLDIMREVGNTFNEQLADPNRPPVLIYDHVVVIDGRKLARPVNYRLLQITPPAGMTVDPTKRPYMIIDPRAGHGPGIGGFKTDSEVGIAFEHGHPVYFVSFLPLPEPGQTLADVTAAEGIFIREVALRHPDAPKPVILGNCQGGWAAALVAASNPHVSGPIVLNGAPLSYWAGERGTNPLRYLGGLAGGALPAVLSSDLGNGRFDGAHLVKNFESMNPGNTLWRKYYNVFANVDTEGPRFKGFEKWWSSYYFMNGEEINWIVQNLFIGNKLQRGVAVLGANGPVDLRAIKAPIIVFASKGDDITPPQQALNWIGKVYGDEREIRARGRTVLYIVHEEIGHLGIFVSAKVARKEHDRIVTTLDAVEALAPGLYEMEIEKSIGEDGKPYYLVSFEERTMDDIRAYDDGEDDEAAFAVVAKFSELLVNAYQVTLQPFVRAMVTPASAQGLFNTHPLRVRRRTLSDRNPFMAPVAPLAETIRHARKPVAASNPFFQSEKLFASLIEQTMDFWRDVKSAADELTFFSIYANPFIVRLAQEDTTAPNGGLDATLRELPQVSKALQHIETGGYAEAVIRMLILMARSRKEVRQSRLQRSNEILQGTEPFRSLGDELRARIIDEQTLIVDFAAEEAISSLPKLLPLSDDREQAIGLVEQIAGDVSEMSEPTMRMLAGLREILGLPNNPALPPPVTAVAEDPFKEWART